MSEPTDWQPYADMLEPGDLPTLGFRVLVRVGEDGEMHVDHAWDGDEVQAYMLMGAVMGALVELFHDHLHEAGDT